MNKVEEQQQQQQQQQERQRQEHHHEEVAAVARGVSGNGGGSDLALVIEETVAATGRALGSLGSTSYYSKSFLAGGLAGAIAKTAVAPLERTKIIFQTSSAKFSLRASVEEIVAITRHEGFAALWRGHSASLARVVPYSAVQLTTFDIVKKLMMREGESELRPMNRILSGSIAGGVSVLMTYPLDLLRARMAVQRQKLPLKGALRNSFSQVIKSEGIMGLFKGLLPTLVGIIPYSGLAFGSFETLKLLRRSQKGGQEVNATEKMIAGAVSGFIAQSVTYPLDVIRRRMQTDGLVKGLPPLSAKILRHEPSITVEGVMRYGSMIGTIQYISATEGIRGFFKGVSLNWIKGPLAVAVSFTSYDALKELFLVDSSKKLNMR